MSLRQIKLGLDAYRSQNGFLPSAPGSGHLQALVHGGFLPQRSLRSRALTKNATTAAVDYVPNPAWVGRREDPGAGPVRPWIWERSPGDHERRRSWFTRRVLSRCVLFTDGTVRTLPEPEFQALLAESAR